MDKKMAKHKLSCAGDPDFARMLRDAGLKATQPRLAIIDFLFHCHGPFTPDEIFKKVATQGLDLTTVYRVTAALEKTGMLARCEFGDGVARYEFHANEEVTGHHHHVICRKCRKSSPLEFCLPEGWKKTLAGLGYTELSHSLEFFGICRDCQENG